MKNQSLTNFNVPIGTRTRFDQICELTGKTRTSVLIELMERHIIEQRILAETPSTLQDLANEYGISRERVRQIEQNALSKLRNVMVEDPS